MNSPKEIPLFPAMEVKRKTGGEIFQSSDNPLPQKLINFWQWSFSDLVNNTTRGILAEYIIATAVGVSDSARKDWDAFDIKLKDGIKIEVKSSAYIQSWMQENLSPIEFNISPTHGWDASTNKYSTKRTRHSDVYVFCVLKHKEQETINPLNLDQWEFHVISTMKLNKSVGMQKSIRLSRLIQLGAVQVAYEDIHEIIKLEFKSSR